IAVQRAIARGNGQTVVRQRIVIDPDRFITETDKAFRNNACLREPFIGIRQEARIDEALIGATLRQMRVAIASNAIRLESRDLLAGLAQCLYRLQRQAIDEIEVQAIDADFAQKTGGLGNRLYRLDSTDGFLNLGVDILHAEAGAVDTHERKRACELRRDG